MRPGRRSQRQQRGRPALRALGRTQRPPTCRPEALRATRNVTVASSESATDSRAPNRLARAGPEGAAWKAAGDSWSRVIAGAMLSSAPLGATSVVVDSVVVLEASAKVGGGVVCGTGANSALTERAALIVSVQLPVPEQSPLQPAKLELAPGLPVSVTTVPAA